MMNNRTRQILRCFLYDLVQLLIRLQGDLFADTGDGAPVGESQPVEAAATAFPAPAAPDNEPPCGIVWFDETTRTMYWEGGSYTFTYHRRHRFAFVLLLWEQLGQHVSAEELAAAFFDRANWKWDSIRRYGERVQRGDLDQTNCPFCIRVDTEGFTLILLQ